MCENYHHYWGAEMRRLIIYVIQIIALLYLRVSIKKNTHTHTNIRNLNFTRIGLRNIKYADSGSHQSVCDLSSYLSRQEIYFFHINMN